VTDFLNGGNWTLVREFVEVESGKKANRPELEKAFQACRVFGAKLVIAKLDRLSRDAHFLLGLEKAGVDFVAADMPHANRLTVGIMAMVADEERRMISARTKAALAAAKRRGVKLGCDRGGRLTAKARAAGRAVQQQQARRRALDLAPTIKELEEVGTRHFGPLQRRSTLRPNQISFSHSQGPGADKDLTKIPHRSEPPDLIRANPLCCIAHPAAEDVKRLAVHHEYARGFAIIL
jgi:hypothetical protein